MKAGHTQLSTVLPYKRNMVPGPVETRKTHWFRKFITPGTYNNFTNCNLFSLQLDPGKDDSTVADCPHYGTTLYAYALLVLRKNC